MYPIDTRGIGGKYVLAVSYFTADDLEDSEAEESMEMTVKAGNASDYELVQEGKAHLFKCKMTTLCRQVVTDEQGRLMMFDLGSDGGKIRAPPDTVLTFFLKIAVLLLLKTFFSMCSHLKTNYKYVQCTYK